MTPPQETKEQLRKDIETLQKQSAKMNEKYKDIPMPSSAANTLVVNALKIEEAEHKIYLLDLEGPCDEWHGSYGKGE